MEFMGPIKLYETNRGILDQLVIGGIWDQSRFLGPIKVYKTIRVFETTGGILEIYGTNQGLRD